MVPREGQQTAARSEKQLGYVEGGGIDSRYVEGGGIDSRYIEGGGIDSRYIEGGGIDSRYIEGLQCLAKTSKASSRIQGL